MSDQQPGPPPPGVHAQPGPLSYAIGSMPVAEGGKFIVLRLEHTAGSTMVALPPDLARQMGKSLIENATGLTLAKPGDLAN